MQNGQVVIGALVGMGPNSTSFFYDRVIHYARKLYGAKYDNDFPHFILYSLPTPFVPNQTMDNKAMLDALTIGINALNAEALGVDYLVIPCNIVQGFFAEMSAISNLPILNLVEIIIKSLKTEVSKQEPVALIATNNTVNSSIFQPQLRQAGHLIFHNKILQTKVDSLLQELKLNKLSELSQELWQALINYLESECCKTAIIACTDISPCLELKKDTNINFIDSCDVLARVTVEYYLSLSGNKPKVKNWKTE